MFKLKERDWKIRSTKVDAGDFKHELLNGLRWTVAVNVLRNWWISDRVNLSMNSGDASEIEIGHEEKLAWGPGETKCSLCVFWWDRGYVGHRTVFSGS